MSTLPPTLGPWVCRWIEANLVHGEGDFSGEPFKLEPFQRDLIWRLYAYDEKTLRRIVRRALLVMPKGNGKTELAAAILNAELAGPTMPTADGRGDLRKSPNIPVAAASFEQADRLFGAMKAQLIAGPLAPYVDCFDTEILLKDRPGRAFRVAAVAGTNDGGLPTAVGADELHEWEGRKARVHLILGNSLAKRADGLELNLSTPDDADPDSLLGGLYAYARQVHSGEVADPSFLFVHHTASGTYDLNDPTQLRAATREANVASWLDLERIVARYEVDRIPAHEYERYHLARFVRAAGHWLPDGAWKARGQSRPVPVGTEVVLGFDGSDKGDSTALVACTVEERPHLFVIDVWERPRDASEDWRVPREEVKARVAECFHRYDVAELAADPPGWRTEIEEWAELYEDRVHRFETNKRSLMAAACDRFYTAVAHGALSHDDDPRLARHLRNARPKVTPAGTYIVKDGPMSPRKIDLAVAAVIAHERATVGPVRVAPSVYEARGLVEL